MDRRGGIRPGRRSVKSTPGEAAATSSYSPPVHAGESTLARLKRLRGRPMSFIRIVRAVAVAAALIGVEAVAVPAIAGTALPACTAPGKLTKLDDSITNTAARLSERRALRIVAL